MDDSGCNVMGLAVILLLLFVVCLVAGVLP